MKPMRFNTDMTRALLDGNKTVTGRDVRDLERCPPVSELIKEDDGFAERIAHAWRGRSTGAIEQS